MGTGPSPGTVGGCGKMNVLLGEIERRVPEEPRGAESSGTRGEVEAEAALELRREAFRSEVVGLRRGALQGDSLRSPESERALAHGNFLRPGYDAAFRAKELRCHGADSCIP